MRKHKGRTRLRQRTGPASSPLYASHEICFSVACCVLVGLRLERTPPKLPEGLAGVSQSSAAAGGASSSRGRQRGRAADHARQRQPAGRGDELLSGCAEQGKWRLVSDMKKPDGSVVLYAEQDGPPLWVRIWAPATAPAPWCELAGAVVAKSAAEPDEAGLLNDRSAQSASSMSTKRSQRGIEVQVHESRGPVAILGQDQLGSALHSLRGPIHLLPIDRQNHIRILLDGARARRDRRASGGDRDGRPGGGAAGRSTSTARSRATASALSARTARATRSSSRAAERGGVVSWSESTTSSWRRGTMSSASLTSAKSVAEERLHQQRDVAQADRRRADRGPADVIETALPQVVHRHLRLQRQRPLHDPLRAHLAREVQRGTPGRAPPGSRCPGPVPTFRCRRRRPAPPGPAAAARQPAADRARRTRSGRCRRGAAPPCVVDPARPASRGRSGARSASWKRGMAEYKRVGG